MKKNYNNAYEFIEKEYIEIDDTYRDSDEIYLDEFDTEYEIEIEDTYMG